MSHDSPPRDRHPGRGSRRTRAAVAVGAILIVAGVVGASALAGSPSATNPPVAAGSPSPAALATATPIAGTPAPTAVATPDPGGTAAPTTPPTTAPTETPTATPTPRPSTTPVAHGGPIPAATLQARLDAVRARLKLPGVTVAILWDDGRQWLGASGQRDVARNEPMTTDTAVAFASVSKTLTAAVVMQLVDEGKLGLDEPVAPLLPEYGLNPRITVRNLLDHTSGLPDYFLNVKIERPLRRATDATWTPADTWAFEPKKRPAPGRFWIYSNANYLLLGELVGRVTGNAISEEVRDRLLDPLGLSTAWYQAEEEPRAPGAVAYRTVVGPSGKTRFVPVAPASDVMPFRSVVTAAGGAGSIAATALDAARWMRAWAGGELLPPALQAEVVGDMARTAKLHPRIPYGLGLQGVPLAGHPALGHSGRFLGIRNVVRYLPTEGVTIAVMTNQSVADPTKVANALLKVILPPLPGHAAASPKPSGSPATP